MTPRPQRPWFPFAVTAEFAATYGKSTIIEARNGLVFALGVARATETTHGDLAHGVNVSLGGEITVGCGGSKECFGTRWTLGPTVRLGWSSGWTYDRMPEVLPRVTLYADLTPYVGTNDATAELPANDSPANFHGARLGLGVSSLGYSSVLFGDDPFDKPDLGVLFAWLNHIELSAEIERAANTDDLDYRLGFAIGFGM